MEKNVRIENERKMKVQNVRSNMNKKNNMDIEDDRDVICLDNEAVCRPVSIILISSFHVTRMFCRVLSNMDVEWVFIFIRISSKMIWTSGWWLTWEIKVMR